jgi:hypothetical protein
MLAREKPFPAKLSVHEFYLYVKYFLILPILLVFIKTHDFNCIQVRMWHGGKIYWLQRGR